MGGIILAGALCALAPIIGLAAGWLCDGACNLIERWWFDNTR